MKKSLIALAALSAFAGSALAQSSVTLYGVVDVNAQYASGKVKSMQSGNLNGSRWGLRGTEDLGGGLKAVFTAESGFNADEGSSAQGGLLFGRQVWVGLASDMGTVRLGRQYSPLGLVSDLVGTKSTDILTVTGTQGANTLYRVNNAATFISPSLAGLTVSGQASAGTATDDAISNFGFSAQYKLGGLDVAGAYHAYRNKVMVGGTNRAGLLVAAYDFGIAKLQGYYALEGRGERAKVMGAAVIVPFGAAKVSAGFAKADNTNVAVVLNDNAKVYTLQGQYDLSKRTALYTNYTRITNDDGSRLTVGGAASVLGARRQVVQAGVRHSF